VPPLHPPQSVCGGSRGGAAYPLRTTARLPTTPHARGKEIGVADTINTGQYAGESSGPRELHPADTVLMQCVDIVDHGVRPESYLGKDKGLKPKCAVVFRSTETKQDGTPFDLSREFTVSTGPKAALRGFLESWRGAPYEDEWPDVPLHKMVGVWAMVTVVHKKSADGTKTYANIGSVVPVPKPLRASLPTLAPYTRPDWFSERTAKYKAEADSYRSTHASGAPAPAPTFDDEPPLPEYEGEDDESIPF
jgi:hypothetical protein